MSSERGGAKAYVVFEQQASVEPALSKNMTVVSCRQREALTGGGRRRGQESDAVRRSDEQQQSTFCLSE